MMPFSSVAIIEKLALVRIAFCKAPVLSNACWRRASVRPSALPALSRMAELLAVSNMAGPHRACARSGAIRDYCDVFDRRLYASPHKEGFQRCQTGKTRMRVLPQP